MNTNFVVGSVTSSGDVLFKSIPPDRVYSKFSAATCMAMYENIRIFATPEQRGKAWDAVMDLDLTTLRSIAKELDLV